MDNQEMRDVEEKLEKLNFLLTKKYCTEEAVSEYADIIADADAQDELKKVVLAEAFMNTDSTHTVKEREMEALSSGVYKEQLERVKESYARKVAAQTEYNVLTQKVGIYQTLLANTRAIINKGL